MTLNWKASALKRILRYNNSRSFTSNCYLQRNKILFHEIVFPKGEYAFQSSAEQDSKTERPNDLVLLTSQKMGVPPVLARPDTGIPFSSQYEQPRSQPCMHNPPAFLALNIGSHWGFLQKHPMRGCVPDLESPRLSLALTRDHDI